MMMRKRQRRGEAALCLSRCARPPTPPRQCIIPRSALRCCVCVCVSRIIPAGRTGGEGGRELTRYPSPVLNLFYTHSVPHRRTTDSRN